jgi:hypothetical protein
MAFRISPVFIDRNEKAVRVGMRGRNKLWESLICDQLCFLPIKHRHRLAVVVPSSIRAPAGRGPLPAWPWRKG